MISFKQNKHLGALVFLGFVLIISTILLPGSLPPKTAVADQPAVQLPTIQSMDHLRKLLNENGEKIMYRTEMDIVPNGAPTPIAAQAAKSSDYSSTNVQVEGVDEADLIKTDGSYIYQISNGTLTITRAVPAGQMKLMSRINFNEQNFTPNDFYITDNKLVLIGSSWSQTYLNPQVKQEKSIKGFVPPYHSTTSATSAIIYDCSDKSKLIKTRELDLKGNYLTSRRIGQTLYLICNDYLNYYTDENIPLPAYRDSAAGTDYLTIPCEKIRYFPDCVYRSYVVTAALQIDQAAQPAQVDTYLGTAENVYASSNNLYIAIHSAPNRGPVIMDSAVSQQPQSKTEIYRFSLKDQKITYSAKGSVPGDILNQFSMDEYRSFFRIATTSYKYNGDINSSSNNNIYVLDQSLQIKGSIEGIAPGERIYSSRFMGDRIYLVTFRKVDPFFVIDLTDPTKPKILGKLKIPGYSDYLHPYDENHVIGFGKDTVEYKNGNGSSQAYYQGMKVAMFDVSNVNNPVEMDKVIIGDRGTDSELLSNHRALLFSREKNLLAFPVNVAQIDSSSGKQMPASFPAYGTFSFQGAYIYKISLSGGLEYKGRITHISEEDYLKAGDYYAEPNSYVQRILYIGNILYTVSENQIQAHQIDDLKLVGSLKL